MMTAHPHTISLSRRTLSRQTAALRQELKAVQTRLQAELSAKQAGEQRCESLLAQLDTWQSQCQRLTQALEVRWQYTA